VSGPRQKFEEVQGSSFLYLPKKHEISEAANSVAWKIFRFIIFILGWLAWVINSTLRFYWWSAQDFSNWVSGTWKVFKMKDKIESVTAPISVKQISSFLIGKSVDDRSIMRTSHPFTCELNMLLFSNCSQVWSSLTAECRKPRRRQAVRTNPIDFLLAQMVGLGSLNYHLSSLF